MHYVRSLTAGILETKSYDSRELTIAQARAQYATSTQHRQAAQKVGADD